MVVEFNILFKVEVKIVKNNTAVIPTVTIDLEDRSQKAAKIETHLKQEIANPEKVPGFEIDVNVTFHLRIDDDDGDDDENSKESEATTLETRTDSSENDHTDFAPNVTEIVASTTINKDEEDDIETSTPTTVTEETDPTTRLPSTAALTPVTVVATTDTTTLTTTTTSVSTTTTVEPTLPDTTTTSTTQTTPISSEPSEVTTVSTTTESSEIDRNDCVMIHLEPDCGWMSFRCGSEFGTGDIESIICANNTAISFDINPFPFDESACILQKTSAPDDERTEGDCPFRRRYFHYECSAEIMMPIQNKKFDYVEDCCVDGYFFHESSGFCKKCNPGLCPDESQDE